jgi:hypothetical protein
LLAAIVVAAGFVALTAGPAHADVVGDAVTKLNSDSLYTAGDLGGVKLNEDAVRAALSSVQSPNPIKVAVLGSDAGDPVSLAKQIGQQLGSKLGVKLTVGVFSGTKYGAGSSALGSGCAGVAMNRAVQENLDQLKSTNDLTATIERFAELASSAPTNSSCSGTGSNGSSSDTNNSSSGSGSGSSGGGWGLIAGLGVLGAGAIAALVWRRKRQDRRALADARAAIQPFYDRLAGDVSSLQPGDNPTARQAMSDASERYNSGGSQMASATSIAQLGGARRSILEGLQATRTARVALGLDPGPDIPPLAETTAPQLTEQQQVNVGGQTVQGYPSYTPGAPYYFAGGGGYAGGWYSIPFWQTLLIAEALSPGWGWGFGGGWGGYGYGSGYDSGFNSGYDAGQDSAQGGGDWGSGGGGGDWGGGGGDWGGGGGGGGGGDW